MEWLHHVWRQFMEDYDLVLDADDGLLALPGRRAQAGDDQWEADNLPWLDRLVYPSI
ncbi:MAG: hypothetical protein R2849_22365 [Thermomicrobiales bacterium]